MDRGGRELAGRGARRCSRAQDLVVAAGGARGADGDPYPGWHEVVEDSQALAKGGGSRASSTRRCSGHEGEERGAEMSAVKMAGGVAPFYRARKAVEGSGGDRLARWVLKTSVMR
jgi:hypothetical protein